jgi:hypothetical protein
LIIFKLIYTNPKNAHDCSVLSYINYQHVSIASDTIIRVALHEYYENYKLPNTTCGTNRRYDIWLKLSIYWLPRDYWRVLFIWITVWSPFNTVWFEDLVILALRGALLQTRLTLPATSLTILYSGQVCHKTFRCSRLTTFLTTNLEIEVNNKVIRQVYRSI